MQPKIKDAYRLVHEGALALADMEHAGIRIDVPYLNVAIEKASKRIRRLTEKLKSDEVYKAWCKRFGEKVNLGSRDQLVKVVFGEMGYKASGMTTGGKREKANEAAFADVDLPFIKDYFKLEKTKKLKGTYLEGIRRELVGEFIHPSISLHTVSSYRSSIQLPNTQNQISRDAEFAKILRRCFIPRKDCVTVKKDFNAIEVRVNACMNKDPELIRYLKDKTTDMHRDCAADLFMLPANEAAEKKIRYTGKNGWTFPAFYGSVYFQCAEAIWAAAKKLKLSDGTTMLEHLKSNGINKLGKCNPKQEPEAGTFEHHVKQFEADFWGRRFKVYAAWKQMWWEMYQLRGWFDLLTGFRCRGLYKRNEVINMAAQGCLAGASRVLTQTDGWIPIEELVGKQVKVWTGFRWADAIGLDRGKSQLALVKLSSGLTVHCDVRHKLKNEYDDWVDFADLREGTWVALPRNGESQKPTGNMNWWFIFGFIIGDGCISSSSRRSLHITVGKKKLPILKAIYTFLLEECYRNGGYRGIHLDVISATKTRDTKYRLSTQSRDFATMLEKVGFVFGWKSKTKRIPNGVWRTGFQQQRDFLEGLWMSGSRANNNLNMSNMPLLKDIQILAGSLGFDSFVDKRSCLRFHQRKFKAITPRRFPAAAMLRQIKDVKKNRYGNECQYISDLRCLARAKQAIDPFQYTAERTVETNCNNPQLYRYDRIVKIILLDDEQTTYTMAVDDGLHQFVADGIIHKNSGFHCTLWSIIRINKLLRKYRMKSVLINEVHDSIDGDVPEKEVQNYLEISEKVMTQDLPKAWPWIIVPMEAESAICRESWAEEETWERKDGMWGQK